LCLCRDRTSSTNDVSTSSSSRAALSIAEHDNAGNVNRHDYYNLQLDALIAKATNLSKATLEESGFEGLPVG